MTPRTRRRVFIALACSVGTLGCRDRSIASARSFEVHDAWARPAADTGSTTAAYVRLINGTPDDVTVSNFTSDAARTVELHRSLIDAQRATHMSLVRSISLGAFKPLVMKPGGYHLMLIGTTRPLRDGDPVRISMHLSNGAIVSALARVRGP